jgi:hypothetical protein
LRRGLLEQVAVARNSRSRPTMGMVRRCRRILARTQSGSTKGSDMALSSQISCARIPNNTLHHPVTNHSFTNIKVVSGP